MISLLVGLIVLALVIYLAWYVLNLIPMPPPVRIVITVLFLIICIVALLDYAPLSLPHGRFG